MIRLNKKTNGHTLVELIIAMAVFSMAVAIMSGSFSKIMSSYRRARNIQNNTEAAQQAVNLMAKTFRTSGIATSTTLVANATQDIRVFDNSQSKCIRYLFSTVTNTLQYFEEATTQLACDTNSTWSISSNLIGSTNNVVLNGNFYIIKADATTVGKVTIRFDTCPIASCSVDDMVRLQTTVSLREKYTEVEL